MKSIESIAILPAAFKHRTNANLPGNDNDSVQAIAKPFKPREINNSRFIKKRFIKKTLIRIACTILEPGQEKTTFRFVAEPEDQRPDKPVIIKKEPTDFKVTALEIGLLVEFEILPIDTDLVTEETTFIYELERTIPVVDGLPKVETIEQGRFTIVLDVAT